MATASRLIKVTAYAADTHAPASGLTPTWDFYVDAVTGLAIAPQPVIAAVPGAAGVYQTTITLSTLQSLAARINFGAGADPQFQDLFLDYSDFVIPSSGGGGGVPGSSDITPPVVGGFTPAPGTPITPGTPISFNVTDDTGLRQVLIAASYGTPGIVELAFDGASFRGPFTRYSTRSTITGGYMYTLIRDTGWPATPSIEVYAIDSSGN